MVSTLWALFIAGQIWQAGNINYQQSAGYYEINPLYGKHPSRERVYVTKALEVGLVWGVTKLFPEYEKEILFGVNSVLVGFILYDNNAGISMSVRF